MALEALWVAVCYDVIESLGDELSVVIGADGECSFFEPGGRPCDGVEEHALVFVVVVWRR